MPVTAPNNVAFAAKEFNRWSVEKIEARARGHLEVDFSKSLPPSGGMWVVASIDLKALAMFLNKNIVVIDSPTMSVFKYAPLGKKNGFPIMQPSGKTGMGNLPLSFYEPGADDLIVIFTAENRGCEHYDAIVPLASTKKRSRKARVLDGLDLADDHEIFQRTMPGPLKKATPTSKANGRRK